MKKKDCCIVHLMNVRPQLASDCIGICSNAILQFVSRINRALNEEEKLDTQKHFFQIVRKYSPDLGSSLNNPNPSTYEYHVVWAFPLTFLNEKCLPFMFSHSPSTNSNLENVLWFEFNFDGFNTDEVPRNMAFSAKVAGNNVSDGIVSLYDGAIAPLSIGSLEEKLLSRVFDNSKAVKCVRVLRDLYECNRILKLISE